MQTQKIQLHHCRVFLTYASTFSGQSAFVNQSPALCARVCVCVRMRVLALLHTHVHVCHWLSATAIILLPPLFPFPSFSL